MYINETVKGGGQGERFAPWIKTDNISTISGNELHSYFMQINVSQEFGDVKFKILSNYQVFPDKIWRPNQCVLGK